MAFRQNGLANEINLIQQEQEKDIVPTRSTQLTPTTTSGTSGWYVRCYEGAPLGAGVSPVSRSSADGTGADAAAPVAMPSCRGGVTSLEKILTEEYLQVAGSDAPFYLKSCNTGLETDIPHQPLEHDFRWRGKLHLLVVILRILIISHPYKFLILVRAR